MTLRLRRSTSFAEAAPIRLKLFNSGKRLMDITVSLMGLALCWPLLITVAILIKQDSPGPVLFCQLRHGRDNRVFRIYKFRTMHEKACKNDTGIQASLNDLRITRIGHFLRRTSIDELPQLINILKGDMALVGPRPHPVNFDAFYIQHMPFYCERYTVKPGLTGWAQVNGLRGETREMAHMYRRVIYDIEYAHNQSFLFDINIILKTFKVIFYRNAY
jgi:putative colanic acid biosysnthesis UDP-glucose lipid carrier transferase